jgi:hypothetical protein
MGRIVKGVHIQSQLGRWLIKRGNELVNQQVLQVEERSDPDGVLESRKSRLTGQIVIVD